MLKTNKKKFKSKGSVVCKIYWNDEIICVCEYEIIDEK